MSNNQTSDLVSKIAITFNDGSIIELVEQIRFIKMRDNLKVLSETNNMLNKQMKYLENTISKLQEQILKLDSENQSLIKNGFFEEEKINNEFKNPLV